MSEERAEYHPELNGMLYIIARNYEAARDFAHKNGHHYSRMSFVNTREKIMGLHDVKLYVLPHANEHKNFDDIIQEAKIRRIDIEYI